MAESPFNKYIEGSKDTAKKATAKAGASAALKGIGGKFLMGAGAVGTGLTVLQLLSMLYDSSQDDSGQGFRERSTDDLSTLLSGSDPNSLQNRLEFSEILRKAAVSDPQSPSISMSSELRNLLTPNASDLINVAKKSKPSLKESYARAGLIWHVNQSTKKSV